MRAGKCVYEDALFEQEMLRASDEADPSKPLPFKLPADPKRQRLENQEKQNTSGERRNPVRTHMTYMTKNHF